MHRSHGRYYRCTQHGMRFPDLEEFCDKHTRCDTIEEAVWKWMLAILTDEDDFEERLREAQELERKAEQPKRERLSLVDRLLEECESDAKELLPKLATVREGGIMARTIQEEIDALEKRHAALTQERDNLLADLDTETLSDTDIAATLQFREDVMMGMQNPTFEDKRRVLELLQVQVGNLGDGQAKATCRIPIYNTQLTYSQVRV